MTHPTGEASNYETALVELGQLAELERNCVDQCTGVVSSVQAAKIAINNMQESYRAASTAAPAIMEQLAGRNLDQVTLAHAGTTADALPAGVVDAMYDQLEGMEAEAEARLQAAETALGSTEANIAHLQATYGDAYNTVATDLGGDASFLASAGGGVAAGDQARRESAGLFDRARQEQAAREQYQADLDRAMLGGGASGGGSSGGSSGGSAGGGAFSDGNGSRSGGRTIINNSTVGGTTYGAAPRPAQPTPPRPGAGGGVHSTGSNNVIIDNHNSGS